MKIELTVEEAREILTGGFPPCIPAEMAEHLKIEASRVMNKPHEMEESVFEDRFAMLQERFNYFVDPELSTDLKPLWNDYVACFGTQIARIEYDSFKRRLSDSEGIVLFRDGSHFSLRGFGKKQM